MTEKEKLGNELRKLRENTPSSEYDNLHISQQELADKNIGLTKYFIGTIERGEANPTLEKFIFHLKALNLKKFKILNVEIDIDKFIEENSNIK
ncbi:helix-turn-helix domain-containing protein [Flavobacterium ardleyense]|uniref:Helix-turn-helix domain-containing protein n=1 Tax=Flavobacterium ardleyense TaxID=2038737 RepID=A0ABW5ZDE6_9FLAO